MALPDLIRFYHELSPEAVTRFPEFYSDNAYFKDPFNEVHGVTGIQRIFSHMFRQLAEPRFVVTEQVVDMNSAMLVWELHFSVSLWGKGRPQIIRGVSHLKFATDGKVNYHRDYWDTAEELYMKLPGLRMLMGGLKRLLAT